MDEKQQVSPRVQLLLKFLQFTVIVLLILNAVTFINHVQNPPDRTGKAMKIDLEALAMKLDPDEENIHELIHARVKCFNKKAERRVYQKGNFFVIENFLKASHGDLDCLETVTYTTNGEYPYLDNLWPLAARWNSPISLALYCGGDDYKNCIDSLAYIRKCAPNATHSQLVRKYLSVHLFFEDTQIPHNVYRGFDESNVNCAENPMERPTSRSKSDRFFYINVARNIARDGATTHFLLASDIELYPSVDLVPQFLTMLARSGGVTLHPRTVYVLAPFEVTVDTKPPQNKMELQALLEDQLAIRFHQGMCDRCHRIPSPELWEISSPDREMGIFTSVSRTGLHGYWEPFYIGTNNEPYFDERIPYEGGFNKMVQAYLMCLLHFNYSILNNGFLVHRPGIRSYRKLSPQRNSTLLLLQDIANEYDLMFGANQACSMFYSKKDRIRKEKSKPKPGYHFAF